MRSITVNWDEFPPGAYVRLYNVYGLELTAVDNTGFGSGYRRYESGSLIGVFRPTFYFPEVPNAVVNDWRAAYAVIVGDPAGVHYAASGGRVITETDLAHPGGCGCGKETFVEDDLNYSFSGRVLPTSDNNQTRECDLNTECTDCSEEPMARYSIHLMLASLQIEDTPISYNSPRGPSPAFKVVYNQREANQPPNFAFSNLGPKWTFNWLSYVTDEGPGAAAAHPTVYVRGGGTETYSGYNPSTLSYTPDKQTLAVLVRTTSTTYERRFPDGSKEVFTAPDGAGSPRRIFMTKVLDAANQPVILTYDSSFRLTSIADSLGQPTTLSYTQPGDSLKITKVTDPFGRFAEFEYTAGKLTKITDPIGIESQFEYEAGTDFIKKMITPYGATNFSQGAAGDSARWLEAIDPLGGRERVEYRGAASIPSSEGSAPAGVHNTDLQYENTFYWDKKAMAEAPGDYTKAQIFHWLKTSDGKVSGIKHSEKKPLENRVWYTYENQTDPAKVGKNALPIKIARLVEGSAPQLSQYSYNALGNVIKETDPTGRVKSNLYDTNDVDVLEVYQRNAKGVSVDPEGKPADKIAAYTYNGFHDRLTETDAAGQTTHYLYNSYGQLLMRTNAKGEPTTYTYDRDQDRNDETDGYLISITSPPFNDVSAVTSFTYDYANRIRTVTSEADQYTITRFYDEIDRTTFVLYPDETYEEFIYVDLDTFAPRLEATRTYHRDKRFTDRHYNANRQMDSIIDPLGRTTHYSWCRCGSLESITDPKDQTTTFNRDLQGRVYQKVFADNTTVNYLFGGQTAPNTIGATSRLKSSTDALNRRANYSYFIDGNLSQVSYTNTSGGQLSPPTASVAYGYDENYNRVREIRVDNVVQLDYDYYQIDSPPALGAGRLQTIDGPLENDTVAFTYDELGRVLVHSINGVTETDAYDSLGRLTTTVNPLGSFSRAYYGVTSRLQTLTYPNGQTANYTYFGNDDDRRLQTLQNLASGAVNLSKFDYTYNDEGEIMSWSSLLGTTSSGRWFQYDDAWQLESARNTSDPGQATHRIDYVYHWGANRTSDKSYNPQGPANNGTLNSYPAEANDVNQLDSFTTTINGVPGSTNALAHDLAGNVTVDGQGRTLEWDAANRLIAVNYTGTTKRSEFTYDGLSRRIKIVEKTGSTVTSTKQFVWIGSRIAQERDATSTNTRRYFRDGERRGLGQLMQSYYYTRDHLGSIREMTNSAGAVQARYEYDPYGKRTKLTGFGPTLDMDFGYTGHYHHAPSGWNFTLYRAYNPSLGRWLSRDPIGEAGGINLYGYVDNDSINWMDPTGETKKKNDWVAMIASFLVSFGGGDAKQVNQWRLPRSPTSNRIEETTRRLRDKRAKCVTKKAGSKLWPLLGLMWLNDVNSQGVEAATRNTIREALLLDDINHVINRLNGDIPGNPDDDGDGTQDLQDPDHPQVLEGSRIRTSRSWRIGRNWRVKPVYGLPITLRYSCHSGSSMRVGGFVHCPTNCVRSRSCGSPSGWDAQLRETHPSLLILELMRTRNRGFRALLKLRCNS